MMLIYRIDPYFLASILTTTKTKMDVTAEHPRIMP